MNAVPDPTLQPVEHDGNTDVDPAVRGRVIKAGRAVTAPAYPQARLIKNAVIRAADVLAEAEAQLQAASQEAEKIVRQAHAQSIKIREEAKRSAVEEVRGEMGQLLLAMERENARQEAEFADAVLHAAFAMAKAIVRTEFAARPELILNLVQSVAREAKRYENLTLRLHPDDAAIVSRHLDSLRNSLSFARDISVVADPDLPGQTVHVDTEMGRYVGGLESRLKKLHFRLFDTGAQAPGELP